MSDPRSFWSVLWSQPPGPHSRLSRYIVANGLLYMAIGVCMYLAPTAVLERVFFLPPLSPLEQGLVRALGSVAAIIGWFYVMGGRTRAASFCLATVVDRLLVPFLFVPLWVLGLAPPGLVLPFAILDPVLAIGAYFIWRQEVTSRDASTGAVL
jgi:hypothetical protein